MDMSEIKTACEGILEKVQADGELTIQGFGKFRLTKSKARTGRNPRTGESIQIPAKTQLKFKPAMSLKKKLNA